MFPVQTGLRASGTVGRDQFLLGMDESRNPYRSGPGTAAGPHRLRLRTWRQCLEASAVLGVADANLALVPAFVEQAAGRAGWAP